MMKICFYCTGSVAHIPLIYLDEYYPTRKWFSLNLNKYSFNEAHLNSNSPTTNFLNLSFKKVRDKATRSRVPDYTTSVVSCSNVILACSLYGGKFMIAIMIALPEFMFWVSAHNCIWRRFIAFLLSYLASQLPAGSSGHAGIRHLFQPADIDQVSTSHTQLPANPPSLAILPAV